MKKINKINNKIKYLGLKSKVNNLEYLKGWTRDFSSCKLKDAGSANIAKNARIASRSSKNKKLDALFDNLITIEELADYIGVSQKTIRNWVAMRSIPFLRIGRKTFFYFEKLDKWFQTKEFEPCQ